MRTINRKLIFPHFIFTRNKWKRYFVPAFTPQFYSYSLALTFIKYICEYNTRIYTRVRNHYTFLHLLKSILLCLNLSTSLAFHIYIQTANQKVHSHPFPRHTPVVISFLRILYDPVLRTAKLLHIYAFLIYIRKRYRRVPARSMHKAAMCTRFSSLFRLVRVANSLLVEILHNMYAIWYMSSERKAKKMHKIARIRMAFTENPRVSQGDK